MSSGSSPQDAHASSQYNFTPAPVSSDKRRCIIFLLSITSSFVGFIIVVAISVYNVNNFGRVNVALFACVIVIGIVVFMCSPLVVILCFRPGAPGAKCCFSSNNTNQLSQQLASQQGYSGMTTYEIGPQRIAGASPPSVVMGQNPPDIPKPNSFNHPDDPRFPGVHPQFLPPPSYDSISPSAPNLKNDYGSIAIS